MTLLACIGPIAKSGPVMQQGMIVDELHVPRLEPHAEMQRRIICERVEEIERFDMSRRQPSARESAAHCRYIGADRTRRNPACQFSTGISRYGFSFSGTSPRRSVAIASNNRAARSGRRTKHLVVDGRRTDEEQIPSLHRLANAKQSNHVG